MITSILNKLGYVKEEEYILRSKSNETLRAVEQMYESQIDKLTEQNSNLVSDKRVLEIEVISLRRKEEESKPVFDFNIGDPIPSGEGRSGYVAAVAGYYKDLLEPKLKQMISVAYTLLEESSNDRDFDLTIKGVVYSFRELMKWGEAMHSEQAANQIGDNEPDEKTLTEKINELTK